MNSRHGAPLRRGLWVVLLLVLPLPCLFGQADPPAPTPAGGDESVLFLDIPSVYSASKYEQRISQAPSSVSVITSDEVRQYGWRDLSEILRSVRGLYTTYDRNYAYLGMRGFSRPGDYNDRFLLLVDGVRVNDSVYGQAFIGTEFILDVDLIDRIEVIRGPSSSLYGANAFFGVINVLTRRGRDLAAAEAAVSAGSFGTYRGRVTAGGRVHGGLEFLASATAYDSAGQDLYYREFDRPETNGGTAVDCDRDRSQSGFLKLSAGDFTLEAARVDRTKRIPTASYDAIFNDPHARTEDEGTLMGLTYSHAFPRDLDLLARISYGRFDYSGWYPYWRPESILPERVVTTDYARAESWTGEFQLTKSFRGGHKVIGGLEIRENTRQDQGFTDVDFALQDRRSSRNWGMYVQDEFALAPAVRINAGIRHDEYGEQGASTHPRLALIVATAPATAVKLIYGGAFRPPNVYELYYNDGGATQKANPGLAPETIRTYELVLERSLGRQWYGTAGVFYHAIDRLITQEIDPEDGLICYENMGAVETRGAEMELETRGWRGLRGRISYAYQEAVDERTHRLLTNSPRILAKVNLLIPFLAGRLTAGLESQYTSARRTLSGGEAGGFGVVNLTLTGREWIRHLEVSAGLYNLLDRAYADPGSREHVQDLIPQNGRAVQVKAVARW